MEIERERERENNFFKSVSKLFYTILFYALISLVLEDKEILEIVHDPFKFKKISLLKENEIVIVLIKSKNEFTVEWKFIYVRSFLWELYI